MLFCAVISCLKKYMVLRWQVLTPNYISDGTTVTSAKHGSTIRADALLHCEAAEQAKWKECNGTEDAETAVFIF